VYLAAAAGLLVAGGVAIRSSNRTPKESVQSQMIHAGQNVVRNNLIEGIHPAFGGVEETMIDPLPDNKFMISGWVDLVTDAGKQDRQNYSVVIYRNEMNDWVGEKVSFIPQM
jgi:hypothetical protein